MTMTVIVKTHDRGADVEHVNREGGDEIVTTHMPPNAEMTFHPFGLSGLRIFEAKEKVPD